MNLFVLIPLIMRLIDLMPKIQAALAQNQNIFKLIESLAPDLLPLLTQIGGVLFPNLTPEQQVEASSLAFDPERVRWIQSSMNTLTDAKLQVDGHYGPNTKKAVSAFQEANGLGVDGWCGKNTSAVVETKLTEFQQKGFQQKK